MYHIKTNIKVVLSEEFYIACFILIVNLLKYKAFKSYSIKISFPVKTQKHDCSLDMGDPVTPVK